MSRRARVVLAIALAAGGCATPPIREDAGPLRGARQLVLVVADDWDATAGRLQRYERDGDGAWAAVDDAVPVALGRAGVAWGRGLHPPQRGTQKREGDGRAPAGAFALGTAFGYATQGEGDWPYAPMTATHWCIDVPASPLYNRIVDARAVGASAVAGSSEPMRRDLHADGDPRYARGLVIEHNADAVAGAGSCIFAHVWLAPGTTTAGCTAMDADALRTLLAWLRGDARPVFVLLPHAEHARLRAAWRLPARAP